MAAKTILILGGADDEHASYMREYLAARGQDVELLDSRWYPEKMSLTFDPGSGRGAIRLPCGRVLEYAQIRAVYWRNYYGIDVPAAADDEQAYIAQNDARSLFESLLIHLPARWVNGWSAYRMHQTKPVQLASVATLGVRVPATLLTNDEAALSDFAQRHSRAIFKPVQGGDQTRRLTKAHLAHENLVNLHLAPITVQAEVPGTNVRVFVAGERVLACEVRTAHLDYRQDCEPQLLVHKLSSSMQDQCCAIARKLNLLWTGIDFRLTPENEYVFLEANPSPMFLGFQSQTGLPLSASLAELLIRA